MASPFIISTDGDYSVEKLLQFWDEAGCISCFHFKWKNLAELMGIEQDKINSIDSDHLPDKLLEISVKEVVLRVTNNLLNFAPLIKGMVDNFGPQQPTEEQKCRELKRRITLTLRDVLQTWVGLAKCAATVEALCSFLEKEKLTQCASVTISRFKLKRDEKTKKLSLINPPPVARILINNTYEPTVANVKDLDVLKVNFKRLDKMKAYLDDNYYIPIDGRKGYALILNNYAERPGAEQDTKNLQAIFEELNYEVYNTKTTFNSNASKDPKEKLESIIESFRFHVNKESEKVHSIIVFIGGHGVEDKIETTDRVEVDLRQNIVDQFNNDSCPGLVGKPKIFWVQACRPYKTPHDGVKEKAGDNIKLMEEERKITNSDAERTSRKKLEDPVMFEEVNKTNRAEWDEALKEKRNEAVEKKRKYQTPLMSDTLICNSCIKGLWSPRDLTAGSYFIYFLCQVIMEKAADNVDLCTMLTEAENRMVMHFQNVTKGKPPAFEITKCKWDKFYFNYFPK